MTVLKYKNHICSCKVYLFIPKFVLSRLAKVFFMIYCLLFRTVIIVVSFLLLDSFSQQFHLLLRGMLLSALLFHTQETPHYRHTSINAYS